MKKLLCLILVAILGCGLCACSKEQTVQNNTATTNNALPFYKVGDSFQYKDLIKIEILSFEPIQESNKIIVSLKFTNISDKEIDVSRFKGFSEVVVGDPEKYEIDEAFGFYATEKRRDFINNEKKEGEGILKAGAKMMSLYEFTFKRDEDQFYEKFGDFLKTVDNITLSMEPWYLKEDASTIKEEPFVFEMDFKEIYSTLNPEK